MASSQSKKGPTLFKIAQTSEIFKPSRLAEREFFQLLSIIQFGADLINAINWLPPTWLGRFSLWAGKLKPQQVAFWGTVSSAVSIYKSVRF